MSAFEVALLLIGSFDDVVMWVHVFEARKEIYQFRKSWVNSLKHTKIVGALEHRHIVCVHMVCVYFGGAPAQLQSQAAEEPFYADQAGKDLWLYHSLLFIRAIFY